MSHFLLSARQTAENDPINSGLAAGSPLRSSGILGLASPSAADRTAISPTPLGSNFLLGPRLAATPLSSKGHAASHLDLSRRPAPLLTILAACRGAWRE